jgi:imidazolonepropionase-like amidohydrolase
MRAWGATYEEIAAGGGGIRSTVGQTRAATEAQLLAQSLKHARWFIRCGTTTVEAKSGYGLSVDDEIKILRVVRRLNEETPIEFVPTFLGAHAIPEDFQSALKKNKKAKAFFATLNSANRYAFLFRIQTAKKAETRAKRIQQFIEMLEKNEKFHEFLAKKK